MLICGPNIPVMSWLTGCITETPGNDGVVSVDPVDQTRTDQRPTDKLNHQLSI